MPFGYLQPCHKVVSFSTRQGHTYGICPISSARHLNVLRHQIQKEAYERSLTLVLGHFALAAASKPVAPEVPIWALMLAPQAMDIVFIPMVALGLENITMGAMDNR